MRVRIGGCMCSDEWFVKDHEDGARFEIGRDAMFANFMIPECFFEHVQQ